MSTLGTLKTPIGDFSVVDDATAEAADFVVCARRSDPPILADNVFDTCAACGAEVQLRPTAPKRPKRICLECAVEGRATMQ
jgi:hypothetical protein